MEPELAFLPAVDVLKRFRARELAPSEYLEVLFDRIVADADQEQPVNAMTELLTDEARQQARAADKQYASSAEETALLLAGLPVAAKEKHAIAGRVCSQGMQPYADEVSPESCTVVNRIRAAGGIIHARTTSPEFSCATVTHSRMWGVTRNPWDRQLSPGGSSGGAGAALASGMTPLATASDIAGSTRIPAGFSGVVGYKAPYGTVPGVGGFAGDWYRGDGAMARTVADTMLLTEVIRGRDSSDHNSLPSPVGPRQVTAQMVDGFGDPDQLRGMRIGYSPTLGDYPVESGVRAVMDQAVRTLAESGAEVEEVTLPWTTAGIRDTTMAHFGHLLADVISHAFTVREGEMEPYTNRFIEVSKQHASRMSLYESLEREHQMQAELASAMEGFTALVTPVSAIRGLAADGNYLDGITVPNQPGDGERRLEHYWEAHMTVPFNVTNRCPVLSVPAGCADGVPVGAQIVGHPFDERSVFEIAAVWERLMPGPTLVHT